MSFVLLSSCQRKFDFPCSNMCIDFPCSNMCIEIIKISTKQAELLLVIL